MTERHPTATNPGQSRIARFGYLALAYTCVGLGLAGVVLPLVPTTPFLLLAAWSASRGSPRLHRWLYEHPYIGGVLLAWERERAVPHSAKITVCLLLALSWLAIWWTTDDWRMPTLAGILFCVIAALVLSRPTPKR